MASATRFGTAHASTDVDDTPKLSIPEFTLELAGPSHRENTTYSLDPDTGEVVADIGYTNLYSYVKIIIKNQPFDPSYGSLYYNVQIKNQNTPYKNWTLVRYDGPIPIQITNSEYTNISLRIEGQWRVLSLAGTQTDIQVEAMLGNFEYGHSKPPITSGFSFRGVTSGWSETQTIIIPANTPLSSTSTPSQVPSSSPASSPTTTSSPATTPTPTPSQEPQQELQFVAIIGVAIAAVVFGAALGLLVYLIKRK